MHTAQNTSSCTDAVFSAIEQALGAVANPEQAIPMKAYMLNQFGFLGIRAEARRNAVRAACAPFPRSVWTAENLITLTEQLWHQQEREFQYAAIDLLQWHRKKLTLHVLPPLLQRAQEKSWWDTVDGLAGIVGNVIFMHISSHPNGVDAMDECLVDTCMWLRRIAMLHQLGWKQQTDEARLFRYALTLADERDFFIRKAIGWALRNYARTAPDAVRRFLHLHQTRFSGLTVREAAKHL